MNFTSTLNVVFQVPTVRTERENQIYPKTSKRKFKGSQLISWLSETYTKPIPKYTKFYIMKYLK